MLIRSVRGVRTSDPAGYAWAGLREFRNIRSTVKKIIDLHRIPIAQIKNVEKQAEQIKFCLEQAEEYFFAAKAVSSATKPVLVYYGIVSLALAEILFK